MSRQQFAIVVSTGLLTVTLLLTAPMQAADEKNPFALWERLKSKTEASETTVGTPKPAFGDRLTTTSHAPKATVQKPQIAYFSASAKDESSTDAAEKPSPKSDGAKQLKKERLAVKTPEKTETQAAVEPTPSTQQQLPEVVAWPDFFERKKAEEALTETIPPQTPDPKSIQNAAFVEVPDSDSETIQQTSGDFFDEAADESDGTPFEIMFSEKPAVEPAANPFRTATTTRELPELGERSTSAAAKKVSYANEVTLPASMAGPQSPSVTLQWKHHGEFSVGEECPCDLILTNSGTTLVRNVVAEAMLPQGLQVVSSVPAPTTTGTSATWTFGELQPGQTRKVELVVVPTAQGDHQMNAFVRMTGGSTSLFSVTEPDLSVNVEGPDSVEVGQVAHYTVNVGNPGTGKAKNVSIQAVIPDGLEHRHGARLTIDIGTLNAGEVRRARLTVTGVKGGAQQLAVRAVGDSDLTDETIQLVSVAEPRLNIGLRGPGTTSTGQPAVYELVVINEGNIDSSNVRAKYRVPEGYEFVSADAGGKLNEAERTIDWFVGTLDPGQVRHFSVTLRPTAAGLGKHQAGVMSELGRVTVAEHETDVQASAKLDLNVVALKPQILTGEDSIYQLKITNSGASPASNVGVSCELPSGLELIDISGPTQFVEDSGAVIFRKMPTLESGKTITIALKTRCKRAGTHKLRVRVASESTADALISEVTTTGVDR